MNKEFGNVVLTYWGSIISSSKSITKNEKIVEEILSSLKEFIEAGVLNESDTYFNLAINREAKVQKEDGLYKLRFAQASDSERILAVYENDPTIEPKGLLGAGVANGALTSIKNHIDDNPKATSKEILEHYSIFNYPTYRWTHAQSDSLNIINTVKELIIEWAQIKEKIQLELSEGRFTFMRLNKRNKTENQTKVIPQCFDGLCLESNFMKILQNVQ